jgi:hypothetical protein
MKHRFPSAQTLSSQYKNYWSLQQSLHKPPIEDLGTAYRVGWAAGQGGNIATIQQSVEDVGARIIREFEHAKFDHTMGPAETQPWELKAPVTNQGFLNILSFCRSGQRIDTEHDLRRALDYSKRVNQQQTEDQPENTADGNRPAK